MTVSIGMHRDATAAGTAPSEPGRAEAVGRDKELPSAPGLDAQGQIVDCQDNVRAMYGFECEGLGATLIAAPLPGRAESLSEGDVNPYLAYLCRCASPSLSVPRDSGKRRVLFLGSVTLSTGPRPAIIGRAGPPQAAAPAQHGKAGLPL